MALRFLFIVLFSLISLGGCAIAPGMNMSSPSGDRYQGVDIQTIKIDADLIYNSSEAQTVLEPMATGALIEPELYEYRIGTQDILAITVWNHPELSTVSSENSNSELLGTIVRNDGTIFFPHISTLSVLGKTVEDIAKLLTKKLSIYVEAPQVDVRVLEYRSQFVYVTGDVNEPKSLPVTSRPMRVVDAINMSGGTTDVADLRNILLIHRDGGKEVVDLASMQAYGTLSENRILESGDHLFVPSNRDNKVFVTGEVFQAGSVSLGHGEYSLADALGDAGGMRMDTSNPAHVYVIRGLDGDDSDKHKLSSINVFHLDSGSPEGLILADRFSLEARDVVFVSAAGITRWGRVLNNLSSTIRAISFYRIR